IRNVLLRGITLAHASWPLPAAGYTGLQATVHEDRGSDQGAVAGPERHAPGTPERDTGRAMTMLPAAVAFERAEDCSLVGCRVAHGGMSGVAFGSRTHRCRVEGCVIEDVSGNGINLGETTSRLVGEQGWWQAMPGQAASQHVVVNSLVERGGAQFFGAVGIW